jgi:hypothetical protein
LVVRTDRSLKVFIKGAKAVEKGILFCHFVAVEDPFDTASVRGQRTWDKDQTTPC